ncbi:hypothetical protein evm_015027 [Chilo suppressalis]|nr:hypothetical protein evm_015027 [Chilo suppressalis]
MCLILAVTGSTDGIGKHYALELARRGFNVVLISRNPDKLRAVATEIEKLHSVKTKTIVADFSEGAQIYSHIEEELKDIPLGVLEINPRSQPTTITFDISETSRYTSASSGGFIRDSPH